MTAIWSYVLQRVNFQPEGTRAFSTIHDLNEETRRKSYRSADNATSFTRRTYFLSVKGPVNVSESQEPDNSVWSESQPNLIPQMTSIKSSHRFPQTRPSTVLVPSQHTQARFPECFLSSTFTTASCATADSYTGIQVWLPFFCQSICPNLDHCDEQAHYSRSVAENRYPFSTTRMKSFSSSGVLTNSSKFCPALFSIRKKKRSPYGPCSLATLHLFAEVPVLNTSWASRNF